jgi:surfactin synthase thioesterase subunit
MDAWRSQTKSGFELKMFDGDHFFIRNNRESIFRSILAQISVLAGTNG